MPVWVVCSESHFSVLIALDQHPTQPIGPSSSLPRLMYYDGLSNQEQPIILTLSNRHLHHALQTRYQVPGREGDTIEMQRPNDSTLIPPLEHVIHTRWPNVSIRWTGSDPIL